MQWRFKLDVLFYAQALLNFYINFPFLYKHFYLSPSPAKLETGHSHFPYQEHQQPVKSTGSQTPITATKRMQLSGKSQFEKDIDVCVDKIEMIKGGHLHLPVGGSSDSRLREGGPTSSKLLPTELQNTSQSKMAKIADQRVLFFCKQLVTLLAQYCPQSANCFPFLQL